MFIKNQLDIDMKKWDEIKQKRSDAGKKHKGNQYSKNGTSVPFVPKKVEQNGTNGSEYVDVDEYVDEYVDVDVVDYNNTNNLYNYIEENFGRTLSPIEYEEVGMWEDNELTRYAISQSVLNGKYNIKYVSRILDNYKKNGIITVQQAQQAEENFKNGKSKEPIKTWTNKEIVPSWVGKEIEKVVPTAEEEQEMKDLLKEYS